MAFLRVEKKKSGSYLRILEAYREGGKTRHRVVASLGKVEDYTAGMLRSIGQRLYELGGGNLKDLLGEGLEEIARYNYGFVEATAKGMSHYGLAAVLSRISKKHKLSYCLSDIVKLLVSERLNDPVSKLSSFSNQHEYLGLPVLELHHIYRGLDYLSKYNELIQRQIFQTGRNLFNQQLDIVFYDVTTFYFSSEQEGELRQKGFGKDGKVGKVQVVFGLLIDQDKNPVAYRLYKGSQYEGHTFGDAVRTLKQQYQIKDVIVVADRGMLSKHNIELVGKDYEFIVGERLKSLPKYIQSYLLEHSNYKKEWSYTKNGEKIILKYAQTNYQGRKLIATFSKKRAKKDAADRQERIEKAQQLLKNPSLIHKKPTRYYLKNEQSGKFVLDTQKIAESKKYDGIAVIGTNNEKLADHQVLDHYRHLFQIEQTFRSFKSHLQVRPMFHWNDKRIEGHIALCYMAYAIENHLLQKMAKADQAISENQLRKSLSQMQVSLIKQGDNEFLLRSNHDPLTSAVIKKLNLAQLPSLSVK